MPLYEYECDAHRHRFEVIRKYSDPPIERCPKCGSAVHKLVSAPAFQFKGTGWYITDYARKGAGDASAKADGDGKADSKSEAKSDATSETKTDAKESSDKSAKSDTASKPAASSDSATSGSSTSKS